MFTLAHVMLYAKGWYEKSGDIWADLMKILELDDYTPFNKGDVYSILIHRFEDLPEEVYGRKLSTLLNDIDEHNSWKFGYIHNGNKEHWPLMKGEFQDYDVKTAVVYYILSTIRFIDTKYYKIAVPKYSKNNPRPKNIELKKVIEVFNNYDTKRS